MAKLLYVFFERGGNRVAITSDKTGQNLPGGPWDFQGEVDPSGATEADGFTGVGNAEGVLEAVRAHGYAIR